MCRIAAWIGPEIALEEVIVRPEHSLLTQSQHATEAKLAVNGDGFGIAWYRPGEMRPGVYRDVLPAWSDGNLLSLCRMIHATLFLGHVRASPVVLPRHLLPRAFWQAGLGCHPRPGAMRR